jgi:hypothetical protein
MLDWTLVAPTDTPSPPSTEDDAQKRPIPQPNTRGHTISSWLSLLFTSLSLVSLILLSGFDCLRYPKLHSLFLLTFGVPLFIGAIGQISLLGIQMAAYPDCAWLRKALWMKGVSGVLVFIMTVAFAVRMGTAERPFDEQFDQAGEW